MPSFCKRHLTVPARILYYRSTMYRIRGWHLDDARQFPCHFLRANRAALWCHDSHAIPVYVCLSSIGIKYRRKGNIHFLCTLRVAGCGRKRKQDDEKNIFTRERERERAFRNDPILMDNWTWHKALLDFAWGLLSYFLFISFQLLRRVLVQIKSVFSNARWIIFSFEFHISVKIF